VKGQTDRLSQVLYLSHTWCCYFYDNPIPSKTKIPVQLSFGVGGGFTDVTNYGTQCGLGKPFRAQSRLAWCINFRRNMKNAVTFLP